MRSTSLIYNENDGILLLASECGYNDDEFILNEFTIKTGFGNWNFTVYSGNNSEGPVPHFHLKKNGLNCDACFCIFEPKYFSHDNHQGMLEPKDLKNMNKILSMKFPGDESVTVWQKLVMDWANLNESFKNYSGIITNVQPDYSKLNYYADQHPAASPRNKKPAAHGKKRK